MSQSRIVHDYTGFSEKTFWIGICLPFGWDKSPSNLEIPVWDGYSSYPIPELDNYLIGT
jgi:hypothetical protein